MASYDLHEFDKDKVFTGEVDPSKIVPIKYQSYEKNSLGQTIIDSNKDINGLRYNIGLNTKKISQQKFDQVIDIEFEEFLPRIIDNTVNNLKDQVSELEAIKAELQATNQNDKSKINNLNEQIRILEDKLTATVVVTPTGEITNAVIPDTIMAGAQLISGTSKDRLLSKNKKAVAIMQTTGYFEIYTGDFDGNGNLKPGAETQLMFRQGDPKNTSDAAAADPTTYMTPAEKLNKIKTDVANYTKTLETLGKLQTAISSNSFGSNNTTFSNSLVSGNSIIYSQAKTAAAIDPNLRTYTSGASFGWSYSTFSNTLSGLTNYTLKSNKTDPAFQSGIFDLDLQRTYSLARYRDDITAVQKILTDLKAKQAQLESDITNQAPVVTKPVNVYTFWIYDNKPARNQTASEKYLADNPDVARNARYGKAPRQHFDDFGNNEGRYWPGTHGKVELTNSTPTNPWRIQWETGRLNLTKAARMTLDDGGVLNVYEGNSVVWSTYGL